MSFSVKFRFAGFAFAGHAAASRTFGVFAAVPHATATAAITRAAAVRLVRISEPLLRSIITGAARPGGGGLPLAERAGCRDARRAARRQIAGGDRNATQEERPPAVDREV